MKNDQCEHCTARGDIRTCEATTCGWHDLWYVGSLRGQILALTGERNCWKGLHADMCNQLNQANARFMEEHKAHGLTQAALESMRADRDSWRDVNDELRKECAKMGEMVAEEKRINRIIQQEANARETKAIDAWHERDAATQKALEMRDAAIKARTEVADAAKALLTAHNYAAYRDAKERLLTIVEGGR